jgi:hypothetical protein
MESLTKNLAKQKVKYPWERYWAPRDGHYRLVDGFVDGSDFALDYGLSQATKFEAFRKVPCLVLLGEPGIGKSSAIEQEFALAVDAVVPGVSDVVKIDLREIRVSFYDETFDSDEMKAWKAGTGGMTLFIDSLDEGLMNMARITPLLIKGLKSLPTERLLVRIACRTAEWPRGIEDELHRMWPNDQIQIRELIQLTREQVVAAAKARAVDSDLFLARLNERDLKPLAIKPITLNFLLDAFEHDHELAGTRKDVYEQGCLRLCEDERSSDGPDETSLTASQRLEVASRIAATLVFCSKAAVWTGSETNYETRSTDVRESELIGGEEDDGCGRFQVTLAHVKEARRTGLFTSRGLDRLGWAHQTYAEFLAARYLSRRGLSDVQVRSLINSADDPEQKLIPQLQETVAWMVGWNAQLYHDVLTTDPEVLLRSDVALATVEQKRELVIGLIESFGSGALSHRNSGLFERYDRLAFDGIGDTLRDALTSAALNDRAKDCAIDIAFRCQVREVAAAACDIALDHTANTHLRTTAAHFVAACGGPEERLKLRPLANGVDEDKNDELKGYALQALWPNHLSASEVFSLLTEPKDSSLYGGYKGFWSRELLEHLQPDQLPVALGWLRGHQAKGRMEDRFDDLADVVMYLGWKNLEGAPWVEDYASSALLRMREYDQVVGGIHAHAFSTELGANEVKRRLFVKALVAQSDDEDLSRMSFTNRHDLLRDGDVLWMLDMVEKSVGPQADMWCRLIRYTFQYERTGEVEAILELASRNEQLFKHFEQLIRPTDLDDPATQEFRASQLRWRNRMNTPLPLLDPPPTVRVENHLQEAENGDEQAWCRLVYYDLELEPTSTHHHKHIDPDLTKFAGWIEADQERKSRILKGAQQYLLTHNPGTENWLGKDHEWIPAIVAYKSLRLLQSVDMNALLELNANRWADWTPIILHFFSSNEVTESDTSEALAALAYSKAPEAVRSILPVLIIEGDRRDRYTTVLERLKSSWDQSLSDVVFPLLQDGGLKERTARAILERLFAVGYPPVFDYAEKLIANTDGEHRIHAVGLLLQHTDAQHWAAVWAAICADLDLAKAVLIDLADHMSRHSEKLVSKLTEEQIAEVFLFIEQHWPREEDPQTPTGVIHGVSPRMEVGYFRDSLLTHLRERGTKAACSALEAVQKECPHIEWISWAIQEARVNTRRKSWSPPSPQDFRALCKDTSTRRIGGPNDLLDVVMESLERIQARMIGETPQAYLLWNEKDGVCWPRDENALSDYLKAELEKDLDQRGVLVGREVEIRRTAHSSQGQRIDLRVSVSIIDEGGAPNGTASVIIEVKGCWNAELDDAMETQLVNRYLLENQCQHGIYLVGWFGSAKWDGTDNRKARAERRTLVDTRTLLNAEAIRLTDGTRVIKSMVMDLTW